MDAIFPEDEVPADQEHFIALNAELSKHPNWKPITAKKPAPADAEEGLRLKRSYTFLTEMVLNQFSNKSLCF